MSPYSWSPGELGSSVDFLQLQLCPPPVSPLGVVPDRVAGPHPGVEMGKDRWCDMMILPDPLGDGPVLLALLGQDALHPKGLQGRHGAYKVF